MIPNYVATFIAGYYLIGLAWLTLGFLPQPFGWIKIYSGSFASICLYIVCMGAVWPLVLWKIVWTIIVCGEDDVEI